MPRKTLFERYKQIMEAHPDQWVDLKQYKSMASANWAAWKMRREITTYEYVVDSIQGFLRGKYRSRGQF